MAWLPTMMVVGVASASTFEGLWTSVPSNTSATPYARHDALRVSALAEDGAFAVACEHGGWLNLSVVACPFATASLALQYEYLAVLTPAGGGAPIFGSYAPESSACDWTDDEAGEYWTGAGEYKPPFTARCARIDWADGEAWIRLREIRTVRVVSMSHLDVGYTGSIAYTLNSYFGDFFPKAIEVERALEAAGANATLHYLTHPWLVYNFLRCDDVAREMADALDAPLECPNATLLEAFEAAVRRGTIAWHAGPMNMQFEFMTAGALGAALDVAKALDDRFGLPRKATLSQRDVPGMTRAVVPLLAAANVSGVSVGVNGGVCPPWVPRLFRWRAGGAEVVAGWHPGGYPDAYACPGASMLECTERLAGTLARKECAVAGDEALCFAFRTDNTGPPRTAEEVSRGFDVARSQFPGARVVAGDLDAFYAHAAADAALPVVTQEIGDVWIPGVASDVRKAKVTRRMRDAAARKKERKKERKKPRGAPRVG